MSELKPLSCPYCGGMVVVYVDYSHEETKISCAACCAEWDQDGCAKSVRCTSINPTGWRQERCTLDEGHHGRHHSSGQATWPQQCPAVNGLIMCREQPGHIGPHRGVRRDDAAAPVVTWWHDASSGAQCV